MTIDHNIDLTEAESNSNTNKERKVWIIFDLGRTKLKNTQSDMHFMWVWFWSNPAKVALYFRATTNMITDENNIENPNILLLFMGRPSTIYLFQQWGSSKSVFISKLQKLNMIN